MEREGVDKGRIDRYTSTCTRSADKKRDGDIRLKMIVLESNVRFQFSVFLSSPIDLRVE